MENISNHISYYEATRSDTAKRYGINNEPNKDQLKNMKLVAEKIFEPVRLYFNVPIYISSFFRTKELNKLIKGAKDSQHLALNGAAIDVDSEVYKGVTNKQIFDYIKDNLEFDQLIWEFGTDYEPDWVHFSYNENNNRKEVLKAYRSISNKTVYTKYS